MYLTGASSQDFIKSHTKAIDLFRSSAQASFLFIVFKQFEDGKIHPEFASDF